MKAINRTTNPTKVQLIERSALSLRVHKGFRSTDPKTFVVERFNADGCGLAANLRMGCLAKAGQTAQYFELGTVGQIDRTPKALTELTTDASIRFRVICYSESDARIHAAADNLRAIDEDAPSSSLVSIQPSQLKGPLWKLEIGEPSSDNEPVIHVEEELFASAKAAAANTLFLGLVLPEAVRQIATQVACSEDDLTGSWREKWKSFFDSISLSPLEEIDTASDREQWIDGCVSAFCRQGHMASVVRAVIADLGGEQ